MNIEVKEFKIKISKIEYTFRLDFEALRKFENKYGADGIKIFNEFLTGKNVYDCIVKILSCSCIEKEWEEKELSKAIPFNFKVMKLFDEVTFALAEGIIADANEEENEEKN